MVMGYDNENCYKTIMEIGKEKFENHITMNI